MLGLYQNLTGEKVWVPDDTRNADRVLVNKGLMVKCDEITGLPLPGEVDRVNSVIAQLDYE